MLTAFNLAKNCLSTTAELSHPSPQAKLVLVANAITTHVGAALHQPSSATQAASGFLFQEAGQHSGQLQRFRQGASGRLQCCLALQVPGGGPPFPALDGPPSPHLFSGLLLRCLDTTSATSPSTAQQPQVASGCDRPPAAVISHLPAGAAQQPQAASLCAQPPAAIISHLSAGVA